MTDGLATAADEAGTQSGDVDGRLVDLDGER